MVHFYVFTLQTTQNYAHGKPNVVKSNYAIWCLEAKARKKAAFSLHTLVKGNLTSTAKSLPAWVQNGIVIWEEQKLAELTSKREKMFVSPFKMKEESKRKDILELWKIL